MAALPLPFVLCAGEGIAVAVGGGGAAVRQLCGDADGICILAEGDACPAFIRFLHGAVNWPFVRKEREQALLDRIFFIMPDELKLHKGRSLFL